MKTLVIVNRVAAHGRAARVWDEVRPVLGQYLGEYDWLETQGPGHATELAQKAAQAGVERVVALGGDGTVHEIVNGLAGSPISLGIIPAGTGNDFCRTLELPKRPLEALTAINSQSIRRIDLPRANGHYYINVAGIGFDAEVAGEVNRRYKAGGPLAYLLGIFSVLPRYSPAPLRLTLDDLVIEQTCLLVAAGNGRYYGGGLKICPEAIPDDGLFDVIVGGDLGKLETVALLPRVFMGTHTTHPKVKTYRVRRVVVESPVSLLLQADGEIIGQTPVTFELAPGALNIAGAKPSNC